MDFNGAGAVIRICIPVWRPQWYVPLHRCAQIEEKEKNV